MRFGKQTDNWGGDVPDVWSRIKPNFQSWEFVEDSMQDGYGIGVIRNSAMVELPPDKLTRVPS